MAGYTGNIAQTSGYLVEQNRDFNNRKIWEDMYNSNNLSAMADMGVASATYRRQQVSQLANTNRINSQIDNSAYGEGYQQQLKQQNRQALVDAYNSIRQDYGSNLASISNTQQKANQQITDLLNEQSSNYNAFGQGVLDYYDDLQKNGVDIATLGDEWSKFLMPADESGNRRAYTGEELKSVMYDENGNLRKEGSEMFDQLINIGSNMSQLGDLQGSVNSFETYMRQKDEKLYNWAYETDITGAKTNLQSFREMVGLHKNDNKYNASDYVNNSNQSVNNLMAKVTELESSLNSEDIWSNTEKSSTLAKSFITDLKQIQTDLKGAGLSNILTGADLSNYENELKEVQDKAKKAIEKGMKELADKNQASSRSAVDLNRKWQKVVQDKYKEIVTSIKKKIPKDILA